MNEEKKIIIWFIVGVLLLVILGWLLNDAYRMFMSKRVLNGLYFPDNNYSYNEVLNYAQAADPFGDWICVNTNGMSPKEAIETCNHEAMHELFAESCEKNPLGCMEAIENVTD